MKMVKKHNFMAGNKLGISPKPFFHGPFSQIAPLCRGFQVGASKIHLGHFVSDTRPTTTFASSDPLPGGHLANPGIPHSAAGPMD